MNLLRRWRSRWMRHNWRTRTVTLDEGTIVRCECPWWQRFLYLVSFQ